MTERGRQARDRPAPLGRNFTRVWAASAISNIGDGVRLTALALLAATLTRNAAAVAGVLTANRLPWLLFALLSGAIVDRVDRRRLMILVNVCRGVLAAALAVIVLAGWERLAYLYVFAFLLGIGETLFDTAAQAYMPAVVDVAQLERANGRLYSVELVMNQFVGAPLGGFLFAGVAAAPFLVDGASFVVSAIVLAGVATARLPAPAHAAPVRTIPREIADGLRWLFRHRVLRALTLIVALLNIASSAAEAVLVLFALDVLGVSEVGFGFILTGGAVGSVAGGLLAGRLRAAFGEGATLAGAAFLIGVPLLGIAFASDAWVVGLIFTVTGGAGILFNTVGASVRQALVPAELLGRVVGAARTVSWGAIPVGAALGGGLASIFGLRAPFVFAGLASALAGIAIFRYASTTAIRDARRAAASGAE